MFFQNNGMFYIATMNKMEKIRNEAVITFANRLITKVES